MSWCGYAERTTGCGPAMNRVLPTTTKINATRGVHRGFTHRHRNHFIMPLGPVEVATPTGAEGRPSLSAATAGNAGPRRESPLKRSFHLLQAVTHWTRSSADVFNCIMSVAGPGRYAVTVCPMLSRKGRRLHGPGCFGRRSGPDHPKRRPLVFAAWHRRRRTDPPLSWCRPPEVLAGFALVGAVLYGPVYLFVMGWCRAFGVTPEEISFPQRIVPTRVPSPSAPGRSYRHPSLAVYFPHPAVSAQSAPSTPGRSSSSRLASKSCLSRNRIGECRPHMVASCIRNSAKPRPCRYGVGVGNFLYGYHWTSRGFPLTRPPSSSLYRESTPS